MAVPPARDPPEGAGQRNEPGHGRGRDQHVDLVRESGCSPPKRATASSGKVDDDGKTTLLAYPDMKFGS